MMGRDRKLAVQQDSRQSVRVIAVAKHKGRGDDDHVQRVWGRITATRNDATYMESALTLMRKCK